MLNAFSSIWSFIRLVFICFMLLALAITVAGSFKADRLNMGNENSTLQLIDTKYTSDYIHSRAFRDEVNFYYSRNCTGRMVASEHDFTKKVCSNQPKKIVLRDFLNLKYGGIYDKVDNRNTSLFGWRWHGKDHH